MGVLVVWDSEVPGGLSPRLGGPRAEAVSVPGTGWGIQWWDLQLSGIQASRPIGEFLPKGSSRHFGGFSRPLTMLSGKSGL